MLATTVLAVTYALLIAAGAALTVVAVGRLLLASWRAAPARSAQLTEVLRARQVADQRGEPWLAQPLPRFPALAGTAVLGYLGLAFTADWLTQAALRRTDQLVETGFRAVLDAMVITAVELMVLRRVRPGAAAKDGFAFSGWLPLGAAIVLGIAGAGTAGL